ncbi:MAG: PAS domain-containing protein, partial [Gammaproteobacteria bacterium]|nr:PAS domain-containing protein [Gammaproteobacteria bacterium]
MSILGLLCVLFALIAVLVLVLYALQRRDIQSVLELSQQLQRIAIGGRLGGRVEVGSDKPEIAALVTAVNHLLTRAGPAAEGGAVEAPKLFADLGDRIHEAVLVHREVILYANRQFASYVGVDRVELVGRRLADLVPPEYAELVSENISRRLAGEAAAERYEIDMVGLQGQVSRLEITSTLVGYDADPALLITGVEIIPTQTTPALRLPAPSGAADSSLLALQSLAEAVIATDREGQITFMNSAAEQLTGVESAQAAGKKLEDVVSLVDETERRVLADPVHQALTSSATVNLSRRALLLARSGSERAIELSASPMRNPDKELL